MRVMNPLLHIEGLGRRIEGVWIWRDVTVQLQPGDRLGLVGPSGAGKSLFLRVMAGLDDAQEGVISFQGTRLDEWYMPDYRRQVVFLPQKPGLLEGSVEDNLKAVFDFSAHRHQAYDRARVIELLSELGRLEDFLERQAVQLSGGEAQMVAVVRALQLDPLALLLDEPTASLDPHGAERLESLINDWQAADEQRALLLTSHNQDQVARVTRETMNLG